MTKQSDLYSVNYGGRLISCRLNGVSARRVTNRRDCKKGLPSRTQAQLTATGVYGYAQSGIGMRSHRHP